MYQSGQTQLFIKLNKLRTSKTVLHIGAHPDDEEIGLLSYFSFKHFARTVYWSATRGEAGQNRINNCSGDALGIYRTWESINAREIDGTESLFGPFIDFGFSKNADETFSKWGKDRLLSELVRAIRIVQPQVIVSRWEGIPDDGHGQHQATANALYKAIEDAADPAIELNCLFPWKTSKFYLSTNKTIYPAGEANPRLEKAGCLKINTGQYSTLLGCSYQEQAWTAYSMHQTQGIDVLPAPGDFYYYLKLLSNSCSECDVFEGIETGFSGIFSGLATVPESALKILKQIQSLTDDAVSIYSPEHPENCSTPLFEALTLLKDLRILLMQSHICESEKNAMLQALERRKVEFEETIAFCLGLRLESLCTRARVTPGESVWLKNRLWNFTDTKLDNIVFQVVLPENWSIENRSDFEIPEGLSGSMTMHEVFIENSAQLSSAYWLKKPKEGAVYGCSEEEFRCEPFSCPALTTKCTISIGKHEITLTSPALHKKSFPGGHRALPVMVVPPISLHPEFEKRIFLISDSARKVPLQVTARCNDEERPSAGKLKLSDSNGWVISPSSVDISLPRLNSAATCTFEITIPPDTPEGRYLFHYNISCRERDYGVILTPVRMGAPGLPNPDNASTCLKEEFILSPSQVEILLINGCFSQKKNYGYIQGAKEDTLLVLQSVGVNIKPLDDAFIAHGDLSLYDSIVVGPNAYIIRAHLAENSHRLLEYVENGGTLIVQYQTFEYQVHGFAPYPFTYNRPHDRVTDEKAEIKILEPDHPVFKSPNLIKRDDFENWTHDRGLYFFGTWDPRYTALLSCADPGESEKKGGLVTCSYGKGMYIYNGYSLYRQLPAGVKGSFRLFFNMLSLKSSHFDSKL